MSGLRWRAGGLLALIAIFTYLAVANFIPKEERVESGFWPDEGLRLGLDLQGGIHWVVGVAIDDAVTHELVFVRDNLREQLTDDGVVLSRAEVEGRTLRIGATSPADLTKIREAASDTCLLYTSPSPRD